MEKYYKINNFNDILNNIKYKNKNVLYIFDIDETILYFNGINNNWWYDVFEKYYNLQKNYDVAEELSYNEWVSIISQNMPVLMDESVLKLLQYDHIFLTARKESEYDLTITHLKCVNIDTNTEIYHIGSFNKGTFIKKYIETKKYDYYVFIDDQQHNIDDVVDLNIDFVDCYLFK